MNKKKRANPKATRGVGNLPVKTLTAKQARGVRGGAKSLLDACATGEHFKKGT